ncbi:MAG: chemotaxis-specific protein-glutamate methyltransferase CheB [Bdellovibrio sp.]|nr:chemotaxis-specific protein-glutamate methyltransferase CheB [Bdellovibrio sp.]
MEDDSDQSACKLERKSELVDQETEEFLRAISLKVQGETGIRFSGKDVLVRSRLQKRVRELHLKSLGEYRAYYKKKSELELPEVISVLTTHKTSFFRENEHYEFLKMHVFPKFILAKNKIRIWSAGTATGEEAYSIAITFLEALRAAGQMDSKLAPMIEIVGTDIDQKSIQTAHQGVYPLSALRELDPAILSRYFQKGEGDLADWVRVKDEVWKLCSFKVANLLTVDQSLGTFDVVFSRNVFIYFSKDAVEKSITHIQTRLNPESWLFVGLTENLNDIKTSLVSLGHSVYKMSSGEKIHSQAQIRAFTKTHPIRVLIVDDSPTIRRLISEILSKDHGFEIVGEAGHPMEADKILRESKVDVMTLDIQMPYMDGVTYLKKLQRITHPPVVMVSSLGFDEANRGLNCLDLGAVDYLEKPANDHLNLRAEEFRAVIRGAFASHTPKPSKAVAEFKQAALEYTPTPEEKTLICIGASAGGPVALQTVLEKFPANCPPILVVQHLPKFFTSAFARKLSTICKARVVEGSHEEPLVAGTVYIAPGGFQMGLMRKGKKYCLAITPGGEGPHCPSVDYLFSSVANHAKDLSISAALLTGMGRDGAVGMKELYDKGVYTVAQDEESSVVFGMPKAAIDSGAAAAILPLHEISQALLKGLKKSREAA